MHVPVLLKETLEYLNAINGTKFIDGTLGSGGHAVAILKANSRAKILGIDWDQASLEKAKENFIQEGLGQRSALVAGNYKDLGKFAQEFGFKPADGILLDLGFSSLQIDDPNRGFSFQADGLLDMRYCKANALTAEEVVNSYAQVDLAKIFKDFGEEKFAKKFARKIVEQRKLAPIVRTIQLARLIGLPDSIRRIFQAIRIEVNNELENLKAALPEALKVLSPGGRLVIISFHSLEDRIVKQFFIDQAKDCICPSQFPTCICDKISTARILTRKPVIAQEEEIIANPRSKSAKLRAIEKI